MAGGGGFWDVFGIEMTRFGGFLESMHLGPKECGGRPNRAKDTGKTRASGADPRLRGK